MKKTILSLILCGTILTSGALNLISLRKTSNTNNMKTIQLSKSSGSEDPDPWG